MSVLLKRATRPSSAELAQDSLGLGLEEDRQQAPLEIFISQLEAWTQIMSESIKLLRGISKQTNSPLEKEITLDLKRHWFKNKKDAHASLTSSSENLFENKDTDTIPIAQELKEILLPEIKQQNDAPPQNHNLWRLTNPIRWLRGFIHLIDLVLIKAIDHIDYKLKFNNQNDNHNTRLPAQKLKNMIRIASGLIDLPCLVLQPIGDLPYEITRMFVMAGEFLVRKAPGEIKGAAKSCESCESWTKLRTMLPEENKNQTHEKENPSGNMKQRKKDPKIPKLGNLPQFPSLTAKELQEARRKNPNWNSLADKSTEVDPSKFPRANSPNLSSDL